MQVKCADCNCFPDECKKRMQVKCADCNCFPDECKKSVSPKQCPNCTWQECCCWTVIDREKQA